MTFVQRQIQVSFSMATGNFQGGGNQASISASSSGTYDPNIPRISARVFGLGGESGLTLSMAIWGMPLSQMNQLSTVGTQIHYIGQNSVTVMAGDAISGMSLVFSGIITSAFVDAQSQPQVCFRVEAAPGATANVQNSAPTSVKGQVDAAQLMGQVVQKAGFQFQNLGVNNVKLRNPYLWGAIGNQIKMLARHGGFEHIIDRGTVYIWPAQGQRSSNVFLSPQTSMVGYPMFNQANVIVKSIFNPQIVNQGSITVQSDLTPACGTWNVVNVTHEIDANMPRGKWFTITEAGPTGSPTPVDSN
jgi:hypothetical protein